MTETYNEEQAANVTEEREAIMYEDQREEGRPKPTPWAQLMGVSDFLFEAAKRNESKDEDNIPY
jgi:hypothetical protein